MNPKFFKLEAGGLSDDQQTTYKQIIEDSEQQRLKLIDELRKKYG